MPQPETKYLFFDTETTGIPQDYKAPCTDTDNWPRLVQLGWILTDSRGNELRRGNRIVRPEGFEIPAAASDVHGITTERALAEGEPLRDVMLAFGADLNESGWLVGHNIDYDLHVVGTEYYRLGYDHRIMFARPYVCTMQATIDFCNIPGKYAPKWPRLQELYVRLFGREFDGAHDAMADISATKECFFELLRRNVISL
jgi:exonuclease RNase T and DNA polymerase III